MDCLVHRLLGSLLQDIAKQIGIIDEDKYAQGKAIVIKGESSVAAGLLEW